MRYHMRVEVYEDETGRRPFEEWFNALPPDHATKVLLARGQIEAGLTGGLKSVGEGVHEWRIDWGRACASTSPSMVRALSCCWAGAASAGSRPTSAPLSRDGRTTRDARPGDGDDAPLARVPSDHSRTRRA